MNRSNIYVRGLQVIFTKEVFEISTNLFFVLKSKIRLFLILWARSESKLDSCNLSFRYKNSLLDFLNYFFVLFRVRRPKYRIMLEVWMKEWFIHLYRGIIASGFRKENTFLQKYQVAYLLPLISNKNAH